MKTESHVYCTLFDSGYLSRGLTLFSSLRDHGDNSPIFVLALDDYVSDYLVKQSIFENVYAFSLADLEQRYPELLTVKSERTRMEYVFTCTPYLIEYASELANLNNEFCVYLDSDLFYFSDPSSIIRELEDASIGLTPHRYSKSLESKLSKYGLFNAGWAAFRSDADGRSALEWYKSQTLEWCSDKPSDGRYADQGYLTQISQMSGSKILNSPGINLAPWNTANSVYSYSEYGEVHADNYPLIFFHFHGLRKIGNHFVTSQLIYKSPLNSILKTKIYLPYVSKLSYFEGALSDEFSGPRYVRKRGNGLRGLVSRIWKRLIDAASLLSGNSIRARIDGTSN